MAVAGQQVPPFPAPQDQELKNIIDKLANFVARNGTKFEEMTKTKQKDNPKFSFLFGGDYFNYYKWRVSVEIAQGKLIPQHLQSQGQSYPNAQASLVQQAIVQQSIQSAPWQQAQQVQQPQVTGQHNASQQPYQTSTESVNIPEFEGFLVKIMQSCTKENISNGKNWIFKHCKTEDHFKQVADYMLLRSSFVEARMKGENIVHYNDGPNNGFLFGARHGYPLKEIVCIIYFKEQMNITTPFYDEISKYSQSILANISSTKPSSFQGFSAYYGNAGSREALGTRMPQMHVFKTDQLQLVHRVDLTDIKSMENFKSEMRLICGKETKVHYSEIRKIVTETRYEQQNISLLHLKEHEKISRTCDVISWIVHDEMHGKIFLILLSRQHSLAFICVYGDDIVTLATKLEVFFNASHHVQSQFIFCTFLRITSELDEIQVILIRGKVNEAIKFFVCSYPLKILFSSENCIFEIIFISNSQSLSIKGFCMHVFLVYVLPQLSVPRGSSFIGPLLLQSPDVDYKPLNPDDVKLPPPQPPSERLIAAVEAFYSPPSHERPRNSGSARVPRSAIQQKPQPRSKSKEPGNEVAEASAEERG
ncbi:Calcium homeostasis endoplasmic reticulum, partial [Paramuricea clavata]